MAHKTRNLKIREARESDLVFLKDLRNDVALQAKLLSTAKGNDLEDVRKWLNEKSKNNKYIFVIEHNQTSELVGYIQVLEEPGSYKGYQFGLCLHSNFQNRGFGKEILSWLEIFLMSEKFANKIMLYVDSENKYAISLYDSMQYQKVGTLHRHVRVNEGWRSVLIMEKLLVPEESERELAASK